MVTGPVGHTASHRPRPRSVESARLPSSKAKTNSIATGTAEETAQMMDGEGEDWLVSRIVSAEEQNKIRDQGMEDEFDILDEEGEIMEMKGMESGMAALDVTQNDAVDGDDGGDEYADMADFEDDNVIEDEAAAAAATAAAGAVKA